MKNIIISADGDRMVYAVPDAVADGLERYCMEFCRWLETDPHAKKYRVQGILCYNEADFIEYLNKWRFPEEASSLVANLGAIGSSGSLPEQYRECPEFCF